MHLCDEKRGIKAEKTFTGHILDSQVKPLFDCRFLSLSMKCDTNTIRKITLKGSDKYRDIRAPQRVSKQNKKTGHRSKVEVYDNLPRHKGRITIILIFDSQDLDKYNLIDSQF